MFSFDSFLPLRINITMILTGASTYYDYLPVQFDEIWNIETWLAYSDNVAATRYLIPGSISDGIRYRFLDLPVPIDTDPIVRYYPNWIYRGEQLYLHCRNGVADEVLTFICSGKIYKECKK